MCLLYGNSCIHGMADALTKLHQHGRIGRERDGCIWRRTSPRSGEILDLNPGQSLRIEYETTDGSRIKVSTQYDTVYQDGDRLYMGPDAYAPDGWTRLEKTY